MDTYENQGGDERRCQHVYPEGHEKAGQQCKGWRVTGSAYCAGHSGLGLAASPEAAKAAAEASAASRQGEAQERSEARKRSLADVLAARLEARADEIVERLLSIAEHGGDSEALRAISAMLDRVYGRPTEHVKHETIDVPDEIDELRRMTPEQRRALLIQDNLARRSA